MPHTIPTRWLSSETAAEHLDTTPMALRARARRAPLVDRDGRKLRTLGAGVYAAKMGRTWRFCMLDA